ncbi:hypothetical protein [Streptomyces sp. V1I6]|uniref:hypothetical protein n=1 Tax=Streptomyces sp. V1I6 TaxID=3042273 RepID=UPI00278B572D|nr:hypothetical protein [Streptomyces sp. V1I6]MDQ0840451.1 hypothetical protein [Streptomyces sp. V1I6]
MAHQHAHPHTSPFPQGPRPHRPGRSFALVNGPTFAVHLLLACVAEDLLATRVAGQINLGVVAILAQGSLMLWSAARYDRAAAHEEAAYEPEEEH